MNVYLKRITYLVCLLFAANTYAQQGGTDTSRYQTAVNKTIAYFNSGIGLNSGLYNGPEYIFYNRQQDDNVFFQNKTFWDPGIVNYDGTIYTDVPVLYDMVKDKMVVQLYNKAYNFTLISEKIKELVLLNHHFVYREADTLNDNGIKSALYDQLYNGKSEVLVRRTKSLLITQAQQNTYPEKNKLFIRNGDEYYSIGSKNSLLNALKDKKKELRKFISDNNITFNKESVEQASVRVAIYYDKLTQ